MKKEFSKLTVKISLIFISIYVVLANAGSMLSARIDVAYSGQIILLLAFSVFLLFYAGKRKLIDYIGLKKISVHDIKKCLFYVPLIIIVLANGAFFYDRASSIWDILITVTFMALVSLLEEILFRGLLFRSIEGSKSTNMAVLISGLTFGFGHIVNIFSGYTGVNQIIQILLAVVIGVVLSVLFVRTKSIVPGIIFHFLFNTASALSMEVEPLYDYISVGIILVVAASYLLYLTKKQAGVLY